MRNLRPGSPRTIEAGYGSLRTPHASVIVILALLSSTLFAQSPPDSRTIRLPQALTPAEAFREITRQSGIEVVPPSELPAGQIPASPDPVPFWTALDRLAGQIQGQVVLSRRGQAVTIRPAKIPAMASVEGPFRTVARGVSIRSDFESATTAYDLLLDLHWEPRFPVFRVDDTPLLSLAKDDLGTVLTTPVVQVRNPVSGFTAPMKIPLSGLTRNSRKIAVLEGSLTATLADKMLTFSMPVAKESQTLRQEEVELTGSTTFEGNFAVVRLSIRYPKGFPVFESFEETMWMKQNTVALISPKGVRTGTTNFETLGRAGGADGVYRFPAETLGGIPKDTAGWKLEYTTPSPLKEVPVRFRLKDIPLP
jgi:hypothetical protein